MERAGLHEGVHCGEGWVISSTDSEQHSLSQDTGTIIVVLAIFLHEAPTIDITNIGFPSLHSGEI